MHVVHELEARILKARALLAFELDHVQRVLAAGLDASDAQWTVDRRCREIESLEQQHDRVLMRRLALHHGEAGFGGPPSADADVAEELLPASLTDYPTTNG